MSNYENPEDPGMFRVLMWIVLILLLVALSFMITGCTQKGTCPTYSNAQQFNIMLSSIQQGMSRCHVIEAWGQPVFVNQKIVDEDTIEQWIFEEREVYMKNGFVCSVKP